MNAHTPISIQTTHGRLALIRDPLRTLGFMRRLRGGRVGDLGRLPRHAGVVLIGLAAVWAPVVAYLTLAPKSYTSGFTLILPGAGSAASVNLSDLGQASSSAASAFSSSSLSPTVTYERLLGADRVIAAAAASREEETGAFGKPRVKLADQTSLVAVEVKGPSPEIARRRAEALLASFQSELDRLRADEAASKQDASAAAIADYETAVADIRRKITAWQRETGLVSRAQYAGMVMDADALARKLEALESDLSARREEALRLTDALGVDAPTAAATLKLHADPEFQRTVAEMAEHAAAVSIARGQYGARHPVVVNASLRETGARSRAEARAIAATAIAPNAVAAVIDMAATGERARLLGRLVEASAQVEALAAERRAVASRLVDRRAEVMALIDAAAALDDLERDYQVAEAVFASAMARSDATKTDIYASYPLVQVLEDPATPEKPSSPRKLIALAAGIAASLMMIGGLTLGWLRRPLIDMLLAPRAEAA